MRVLHADLGDERFRLRGCSRTWWRPGSSARRPAPASSPTRAWGPIHDEAQTQSGPSGHAYVVSAARTPIGKFGGALAGVPATTLGAIAIRRRGARWFGPSTAEVDDVLMGQVLQAGAGQAPARQAAIRAGLRDATPATTINRVCGSGLKAIMLAAAEIRAGDAELVVAGGWRA